MCLVCPTPCAVRLGITGAEHTRPCWYLCWYLFQRGQMCLVCPTPCAVRLGVTGAEHTRPCWYLCWYLFRTVLRLVSPGNVSLARARTRTGTSLGQFAWVSQALYILARVGTSCWYLFCTVLRLVSQTRENVPSLPYPLRSFLGITGAEHTRPCWYLCWYLFQRGQMCLVCPTPCAVRLGITGAEHTRPCWYLCWYLFRTVLRLVSPGNVSLARARTRTGTSCAVLRSVGTGNVPTCPCSCLCCV